jgi:hypothetical protein
MARQGELDALYASIDARVTEYDALLAQLVDLNAQVDELNQSINVTPRPEPELEPKLRIAPGMDGTLVPTGRQGASRCPGVAS